nr:hypothetical protein BaRGS_020355 [Batillaria attramentaria]
MDGKIPDERVAMQLTPQTVARMTPGQPAWPANVVSQYPPLPASLDAARVEEIRRTVYIGNLDHKTTADSLITFFSQVGEVKYVRMAGDETSPVRVSHAKTNISKPLTKSQEASRREIEEAMKKSSIEVPKVKIAVAKAAFSHSFSKDKSKDKSRDKDRGKDKDDKDGEKKKDREEKKKGEDIPDKKAAKKRSKKDKKKERSRSRDRKDKEKKKKSSKDRKEDREKPSRVTRDYDEEEKGFNSGSDHEVRSQPDADDDIDDRRSSVDRQQDDMDTSD